MSTAGMRALGLTHSPDVTDDAVGAVVVLLHDQNCYYGKTSTCELWSAQDEHRDYYRDQARAVLQAAAPYLTAPEQTGDQA